MFCCVCSLPPKCLQRVHNQHKSNATVSAAHVNTQFHEQFCPFSEDGFFPNPYDCTKFYRCVGGRRYDFDCGPGTHWNPQLTTCDWPNSAGCQVSKASREPESNGYEPSFPREPESHQPEQASNEMYDAGNEYAQQIPPLSNDRYRLPVHPDRGHHERKQQQRPHRQPEVSNAYVYPTRYTNTNRKYPQAMPEQQQRETLYEEEGGNLIQEEDETPEPYNPVPVKPPSKIRQYPTKTVVKQTPPPPTSKPRKAKAKTQNPETSEDDESYVIYARDNGERKKASSNKGKPAKLQVSSQGSSSKNQVKKSEKSKKGNPFPNSKYLSPSAALKQMSSCEATKQKKGSKPAKACVTNSNYDWLSIADAQPESKPAKTIKFKPTWLNQNEQMQNDDANQELMDQIQASCDEYCRKLIQTNDTNTGFISCVAYSFSSSTCQLYGQLELDPDWVQALANNSDPSLPRGLQRKPGTKTQLNVPRKQLVLQSWIVTNEQEPEELNDLLKDDQTENEDEPIYKQVKKPKSKLTLVDCFKECLKQKDDCKQFAYIASSNKCFLSPQIPAAKSKQIFNSDVTTGYALDDVLKQVDDKQEAAKLKKSRHFYEETDPQILDLVQDLIMQHEGDFSGKKRKYFEPMEIMSNITDTQVCQDKCHETWKKKKDDAEVGFKENEDDENGHSDEDDHDDEPSSDGKARCKFVAVQEDLDANNQNATNKVSTIKRLQC